MPRTSTISKPKPPISAGLDTPQNIVTLPAEPDSARLAEWRVEQLVAVAAHHLEADSEERIYLRASIRRLLEGIAPRDCLEELIAEKLILTHFAARTSFQLASQEVSSDRARNLHLKYAVTVTALFARLEELLVGRRERERRLELAEADPAGRAAKPGAGQLEAPSPSTGAKRPAAKPRPKRSAVKTRPKRPAVKPRSRRPAAKPGPKPTSAKPHSKPSSAKPRTERNVGEGQDHGR